MKKDLLLLMLLAILSASAFPQATDSLKIDSLEKQLMFLKDSAKVDCLNLLARKLSILGGPAWTSWTKKADSVYHYASIAYREANKIDYKKGIAVALNNLATSELLKGIDLRISKQNDAETLKGMENYLLKAIPIAAQLQDYEILGYAYESMSDLVWVKSKYKDFNDREEYFKKAIDCFHISGDGHKEGEDCLYHAERYVQRGYYEQGLEYLQHALELNKKSLSKPQTKEEREYCDYLYQQSLIDVAGLYRTVGDYETAMNYLLQGSHYAEENRTEMTLYDAIAELYCKMTKYDSAMLYWNKWKNNENASYPYLWGYRFYGKTILTQIYLGTNKPEKVISLFNENIDSVRNDRRYIGDRTIIFLLSSGEAFKQLKNYDGALKCFREAWSVAQEKDARAYIMETSAQLSKVYHQLNNNDSAYFYLQKYTNLKDSVLNRQFLFRLNNYKKATEDAKKESRIGFLNRDNQIKQQQLKQQATFRNFLIAVLIAIVFAGLYVFRNINLKRKNEKLRQEQKEQEWKLKALASENKHVELQKQSAELEMQALRAQMNPHFIFNSLSSINHFILKNESKIASNYLTRFSRLMRMVLMNSQKPLIALEDELQMLALYLEMERLRFKDSFDYRITFLNVIDSDHIFIPPLLLQPFCENAIWHGLMHKEGQGRLDIELILQDNILNCIITDNGVGREKAEELNSKTAEKQKSMGLKITTERLALLNRERGVRTFYDITDMKDENGKATGTKVTLKISFKESVEEVVLK